MAPYEKAEGQFDHESPAAILQGIMDIRVFPLLLETALMAVFTIQTIYFVYHRCSAQERRLLPPSQHHRPHINSMLSLSIWLYLLALAYWLLDVIIVRQELLVFLPEQLSTTRNADAYAILTDMLGTHWYVQTVLQMLIWTSSDGVVLWRAYAVWGRARWLKITVVVLFLVEIGVYLDYLVFYLYVLPRPPHFIQSIRSKTGSKYIIIAPYLAAASTTLAVQISATTLIALKAWKVWKSRKGLFQGPGRVFRALAVLIESGVVYTLLWVWYTIATNGNILSFKLYGWTDYYLMPLTAMYPTLVVMIVTIQDSVLTNVEKSPSPQSHHAKNAADIGPTDDSKY